jgi:hypothetical protein
LVYFWVIKKYTGTIVKTIRDNFQLIKNNITVVPTKLARFFNKKVKLFEIADLAWFISLPNLLINYPVLYI